MKFSPAVRQRGKRCGERESPSGAQLVAVHLAGCSLCRLHLWGGRPAQPCRALPAACACGHTGTRAPESSTHGGAVLTARPARRTTPQRECRHLYRTCWAKLWGTGTVCCLSRTAVLATASPLQHNSPATQAQPWGTFGWETRKENYISRADQI